MQARRCLEQHKALLLTRRLVEAEPWAAHYAEHPGARMVQTVEDVLERVEKLARLYPGPLDHPLWKDIVRVPA